MTIRPEDRWSLGTLAGTAGFLAAAQLAAAFAGFVATVLLTRMLGPSEYGLVVLATSYPSLVWALFCTKPGNVVARSVARAGGSGSQAEARVAIGLGIRLEALAAILAGLTVIVTAPWLATAFYGEARLGPMMSVYAISFIGWAIVGASQAVLLGLRRQVDLAALALLEQIAVLLAVLVALRLQSGAFTIVAGMAAAQASAAIATALWAVRRFRGRPRNGSDGGSVAHEPRANVLRQVGWNWLGVSLSGVGSQVPVLLLGRAAGPEGAAFFRLAMAMSGVAGYAEAALARLVFPLLCAGATGRGGVPKARLYGWSLREGVLAAGWVLLVAAAAPLVSAHVLDIGSDSFVFGVRAMLASAALTAILFWVLPYWYADGRFERVTLVNGAQALLLAGAGWWVAGRWGFEGMAVLAALGKVAAVVFLLGAIIRELRSGADVVRDATSGAAAAFAKPTAAESLEDGFPDGAPRTERVVIVSGLFPPAIGGPATHSADLAAELRRRGNEVTVVTLRDPEGPHPSQGLVSFPRTWPWPLRFVAIVAWLARNRHRYGVVYTTGMMEAAVVGARLARRRVVVKVVGDRAWERGQRKGLVAEEFEAFQLRQSGLPPEVRMMRWLRNRALSSADAIVAPSAYIARVTDGWLGCLERTRVVPNGVAVPASRPRTGDARAGRLRVVSVGRLIPLKRVDVVLEATARCRGVELRIVGGGPESVALRSRAESLNLEGRAHFVGQLPHSRVLEEIQAADVLVIASEIEAMPHVAIEAIACGTPVVASDVGGIGEIVRDGHSGLLLATIDAATLAAALACLRDDLALRAVLEAGAREAGSAWTIGRVADQLAPVLLREAAAAGVRV